MPSATKTRTRARMLLNGAADLVADQAFCPLPTGNVQLPDLPLAQRAAFDGACSERAWPSPRAGNPSHSNRPTKRPLDVNLDFNLRLQWPPPPALPIAARAPRPGCDPATS